MTDISKAFPGVQALDHVSFDLKMGEIHALVGENGAGKSTLMKILSGAYMLDSGHIERDGKIVNIANPKDAIDLGIGIVYQELNLVPAMTAAQNIFLSNELVKSKLLDTAEMNAISQTLLDQLADGKILATTQVRDMSIAQQQMVEIAKALNRKAKILIFDEPTSILGTEETRMLFDLMRRMQAQGISMIYISHRLDEIFELCDRVTVLRDGCVVETMNLVGGDVTKDELIKAMVGRELNHAFPADLKMREIKDEYALDVDGITREREFHDVSFKLRKGEILGFSGLVGAGRTEVMRAICGLSKPSKGHIRVFGKQVAFENSSQAIKLGIGLVPENRKKEGLFLEKTVLNNMTISSIDSFAKYGIIRRAGQRSAAKSFIDKLSVRPGGLDRLARDYSGGNQQKLVLAKVLMSNPQILILDEPTRGVDVGAKLEIYNIITDIAKQGISIILVSSELEEILRLSDRIIVMHEGGISGELSAAEASPEKIIRLASGMCA